MLDHGGFVVSDLARARRFYSAIAEPLGLQILDGGPTRATLVHNRVLDPGVELIGKPFTVDRLAAKVRAILDA